MLRAQNELLRNLQDVKCKIKKDIYPLECKKKEKKALKQPIKMPIYVIVHISAVISIAVLFIALFLVSHKIIFLLINIAWGVYVLFPIIWPNSPPKEKYFFLAVAVLILIVSFAVCYIDIVFNQAIEPTGDLIINLLFRGSIIVASAFLVMLIARKCYDYRLKKENDAINKDNAQIELENNNVQLKILCKQERLKREFTWYPPDDFTNDAVDDFIFLVRNGIAHNMQQAVAFHHIKKEIAEQFNPIHKALEQQVINQGYIIESLNLSSIMTIGGLIGTAQTIYSNIDRKSEKQNQRKHQEAEKPASDE